MTEMPGQEFLDEGLPDLLRGELSVPALLLLIAGYRLRRVGVPVPERTDVPDPEGALYARLAADGQRNPHGRYLSLIRRLESLEHAAELRHARARRLAAAGPGVRPGSGADT